MSSRTDRKSALRRPARFPAPLLAYLRLVLNPRDPVALKRVLNVPPRGIGERSLDEIEALAAARGVSAWEALGSVVDEARLPARATQPLAREHGFDDEGATQQEADL